HLTDSRFAANTKARNFLFRGHRDACWHLTPGVLRDPSPFDREIKTLGAQLEEEEKALVRFLDAAHQAGLAIHGSLDGIRAEVSSFWGGGTPQDGAIRLACIAQHHGMPTRLLDWSLEPLVAAYFACVSDDMNVHEFEEGAATIFIVDQA